MQGYKDGKCNRTAYGKMKALMLLALVVVLEARLCWKCERRQIQNPRVRTQNGIIEGIQSHTVDTNKTYYSFHGIPFALPPINDLRFQPPVPANNWEGIYNATYERDICVQGANPVLGSEDCLYINVYTPQLPSTKNRRTPLPVMVWIYGGAFIEGNGNYNLYGPDYLVGEDVVVVTFNYRLGPLGFLSTEDLVVPGNNGLKDQILALKWVQNNIADFGGNLKSVTVFGESAGAASIAYLIQTPITQNLYHRAILQSGSSLSSWALSRKAREAAFTTGRILGINTDNSSNLTNDLRKVPFQQLQEASINASNLLTEDEGFILNGFIFGPVKEPIHDGAVFTGLSHEMLRKGKFNRVPVLMGINSEEGIFFAPFIDALSSYIPLYDSEVQRLVPVDMNINDANLKRKVGERIKTYYVGDSETFEKSRPSFIHFVSDGLFVRGQCQHAKLISKEVDVYFYELSYEGQLGNPNRTQKGVGHAEDLNYLFRNSNDYSSLSKNDKKTRYRMVRMWTNFAKTGNPTPIDDILLQGINWRVASTTKNLTYLKIEEDMTLLTNPHAYDVNIWDYLYETFGNSPYDTY